MKDLKSILLQFFPEEAFLKSPKKKEKGRAFSIKPEKGEAAVGIDLEAIDHWPQNEKRCDALFLCWLPERNEFLIVLVELKGNHREKALEQIRETRQILCRGTGSRFKSIHAAEQLAEFRSCGIEGHGKRLLGIIIGKKSLPIKAKEKADLYRKTGIIIQYKTGGMTGISCRELWRHADGTSD